MSSVIIIFDRTNALIEWRFVLRVHDVPVIPNMHFTYYPLHHLKWSFFRNTNVDLFLSCSSAVDFPADLYQPSNSGA